MFPNGVLVESAHDLTLLVDAYIVVRFPTSPIICRAFPGTASGAVSGSFQLLE